MITGALNPKLKLVQELLASRQSREEHGLFILESPKAIQQADPSFIKFILTLPGKFMEAQAQVHEVDPLLFSGLTSTETSQGVLAVVCQPSSSWEQVEAGPIVVMDAIQDPGNAGTIIRSAAAFGCKAVAFTKGTVDVFSPKVVRASVGAVLALPLLQLINAEELKSYGYTIVITDSHSGDDFKQVTFAEKPALVFSNEGAGVSADFQKFADQKIRILHSSRVESLNVAVSAGIILQGLY
jgi:TrmH family RNA methyltransferase